MSSEQLRAAEAPDAQEQRGASRSEDRWRLLPLLAAVLFTALAVHAARRETPTVDEFAHVPAGLAYLAYGDYALYGKTPPLFQMAMGLAATAGGPFVVSKPEGIQRTLGWGPWHYASEFMRANPARYFEAFFFARLASTAAALLTAWLLWVWARDWWGERAASITSALFLLSPSVLAHGHLATVDMACAATVLASLVALRWATVGESRARVAVAGVVFGVALLVKFTALLLAPVLLVLLAWKRRRSARGAVVECLLLGVVALAVVNLGMGMRGSFSPLGGYVFRSNFAQSWQQSLPAWMPVPVPRAYARGFDAIKRDSEQGEIGNYLLGRWTVRGVWYHDLVAFGVKTPVAVLALLAVAPFAVRRQVARGQLPVGELLWLLLPCAVLGYSMLAENAMKIGHRYWLPMEPLLWLGIASVFSIPRGVRWLSTVAGVWLAGCVWSVHPNYLSFFNWVSGGPDRGHEYLIGADLDWGQDLYRLPAALEALGHRGPVWLHYFGHVDPGLYGIDYRLLPERPVAGIVVVSASSIAGQPYPVTAPNGDWKQLGQPRLDWLRKRQPDQKLGTLWLYDTRANPQSDLPKADR